MWLNIFFHLNYACYITVDSCSITLFLQFPGNFLPLISLSNLELKKKPEETCYKFSTVNYFTTTCGIQEMFDKWNQLFFDILRILASVHGIICKAMLLPCNNNVNVIKCFQQPDLNTEILKKIYNMKHNTKGICFNYCL